jgi:hypothetical protein
MHLFLLLSLSPWWFFCLSGVEAEEKVVVLAAWHVGLRSGDPGCSGWLLAEETRPPKIFAFWCSRII